MVIFRILFLLNSLFLCFNSLIFSQINTDSTYLLPDATVTENRIQNLSTGFKIESVSKEIIKQNFSQNLGDILSLHSPVFIKNYGPSRLSSSAFRGGSASQTAVLWQGFNIQSQTLGQTDFSNLPGFLFEEVSIQYGSSGALWGSGTVGGSIHLDNLARFDSGWSGGLNLGFGSFSNVPVSAKIGFGEEKASFSGKVFNQFSKNDFEHSLPNGETRKLPHAELKLFGFLTDYHFKLNEKQTLSWHFWYNRANRQIPPTQLQNANYSVQKEASVRNVLEWKMTHKKSVTKIRNAIFSDDFQYDDDTINIHSKNETLSVISEMENDFYLTDNQQISLSVQYNFINAKSTGFEEQKTQNRLAFLGSYSLISDNQKGKVTLNLRQEIIDQNAVPFTPSLGWEYRINSNLNFRGNLARSFRIPTFNDRYWSPSGNPDLESEKGWSEELGLEFKSKIGSSNLRFSTTVFNRNIKNWIIWLPNGNSIWSPENILEVWSRGVENELKIEGHFNKTQWLFSGRYDLIYSTNQKAKFQNDASLNKQLIYVPNHKASFYIQLKMSWLDVFLNQNFTGKVYTVGDNSESLDGYGLTNLGISKNIKLKGNQSLRFQFKINNLLDKDYQVVSTFPMPGRHFEAGLSMNFFRR